MRTALDLSEDLIEQARKLTHIKEKTALIHEALATFFPGVPGRVGDHGWKNQESKAHPSQKVPEVNVFSRYKLLDSSLQKVRTQLLFHISNRAMFSLMISF